MDKTLARYNEEPLEDEMIQINRICNDNIESDDENINYDRKLLEKRAAHTLLSNKVHRIYVLEKKRIIE